MSIEVRAHDAISGIPQPDWDGLEGVREAPFLRWSFLDALERTGCVGEETGWLPHHLTFHQGGKLVAAAPAYVKDHSEGEFVFDYGWANASERAGIPYYPKLLVAVPFTPATAARLLLAEGADRPLLLRGLAEALAKICEAEKLSSAHVLFPTEPEADGLAGAGMLTRLGTQFHWTNDGYATFEDFLGKFSSKRRNQIRRERKEMEKQGITITTHRAEGVTPEVVDHAYRFYQATVDKFVWGRRYLNRPFFEEMCTLLRGQVEVVLASVAGKVVAGAFNFAGPKTLFGRYWGASQELPFLHFNVCFYHSIESCIERGLTRFEPGAGGRHKLARGFEPTITRSLHHLAHPGLARAVGEFLEREREVALANCEQKHLAWR